MGSSKRILARGIVDCGSNISYIVSSVANEANLRKLRKVTNSVATLGGGFVEHDGHLVEIRVKNIHSESTFVFHAQTLPEICAPISVDYNPLNDFPHLDLAEHYPLIDGNIDFILGCDFLWYFLDLKDRHLGSRGCPIAIASPMGFIVSGRFRSATSLLSTACFISNADLNSKLAKFWDLETFGILPEEIHGDISIEDSQALQHFADNVKFNNGRYCVRLCFKDSHPKFKDNYDVAFKRLLAIERKCHDDPAFGERYKVAINEYAKRGWAEVTSKASKNLTYTMPHSAVERMEKSTKTRIVFDGSSHARNTPSLNDCVNNGPCLIPKIVEILLRFRRHPIALVADIRKMFLQIEVDERDRDCLRFLWRDLDSSKEPTVYRMTVVTFGVGSSPFLAIKTVKFHAECNKSTFPREAAVLEEDLYVDDLLTGERSIAMAKILAKNVRDFMKRGGFELTKWASSHQDALSLIPEEDRATDSVSFSDGDMKTLGISWDPRSDTFKFVGFSFISAVENETKRTLTSKVSSFFDPLGFICPLLVEAKTLLRTVWTKDSKWDSPIEAETFNKWKSWVDQVEHFTGVVIPRCTSNCDMLEGDVHLHGFSDASLTAFAAVIYMVVYVKGRTPKVTIVMAKSRLCPKDNKFSIARLELLGALLLARLMKVARETLNIDRSKCYFWTDSKVTFHWIQASPTRWGQWVCNRVTEIQQHSDPIKWRHVPGELNPSDVASRGSRIEPFLSQLDFWLHGPQFLLRPSSEWPKLSTQCPIADINSEARKVTLLAPDFFIAPDTPIIDEDRFSDWLVILRVVAYAYRYFRIVTPRINGSIKFNRDWVVHPDELEAAEIYILRCIQKKAFGEDFDLLQSGSKVPKSSSIFQLVPFWDEKLRIIRINDRLQRYPILLPACEKGFMKTLIMHNHEEVFHQKATQTLARLRRKYWIITGFNTVKRVIDKNCFICKKLSKFREQPQMAPLPELRIKQAPPFSVVGIDFHGPVFAKDVIGKEIIWSKGWIVIFVCAVTRGIHLEFVRDMSTPTFWLAFQRFSNRRGLPNHVISDNAKTFKRAAYDLSEFWNEKLVNMTEVKAKAANEKIEWHFIVEKSPWMGGFYERLNRTINDAFRKILRKTFLTEFGLMSFLTSVERIINSRPLTVLRADVDELAPITPAQLIIGRDLEQMPEIGVENFKEFSIDKIAKHRQTLSEHFWKRWRAEYLSELSIRQKWCGDQISRLKVNDIVLVFKENSSQIHWPLGRILELQIGRDNIVRSALVKVEGGVIRRPISQLYNLEANCD